MGVGKFKPASKSSKRQRKQVSARPLGKTSNAGKLTQALADAAEARAHQAATAEILKVISNSPTDVQPVFDAIVRSAARLFGCNTAIQMLEDGKFYLRAVAGFPEHKLEIVQRLYPLPFDPQHNLVSRSITAGRIVELDDTETPEAPPGATAIARAAGYRALSLVPLLREGSALGALSLTWQTPMPGLNDKQRALLRTFADQAVIAIENVRLFNETRDALERQSATADILGVISSSPGDLQPVFDTIAEHAVRLCGGQFCTVTRFDGKHLHLTSSSGLTATDLQAYRSTYPRAPEEGSATGRAILHGAIAHIPDVEADPGYGQNIRRVAETVNFRSVVSVPLLRDGQPIGAITVSRAVAGPFPDKQVALLKTFADQAVIAIENVTLFHELQERNAQIEAASRHKSEFLANMSHELRTPLNAILGFSEVLGERYFGELNEKQEEYVKDIFGSGNHLLSLINDILDLSKVEAGKMELELSDFELPEAMHGVVTLVKERAQKHGIALGLDLESSLGSIRADERKFKQIMLNLLSNAVKFTPDGGSITVAAKSRGAAVEVSVTDTGAGIAPEDQPAVFEEFKQVGPQSARKAEGTGLGLPLAKKFVELHGGEIWVNSKPGEGSTFSFRLPTG